MITLGLQPTDTLLATVAAVIPVFLLAAMFEAARERKLPPATGSRRLRRLRVLTIVGLMGSWANILLLCTVELVIVQELGIPEGDRKATRGDWAFTALALSIAILLITVALGAVSTRVFQRGVEGRLAPPRTAVIRSRQRIRRSRPLR